MKKKKAIMYVQDGCHHCVTAEEEIRQRQQDGTCCLDIKIQRLEEMKKVPKEIESTPTVKIGKKFMSFQEALNCCPVKKNG